MAEELSCDLTVILPALNEAQGLQEALEEVCDALDLLIQGGHIDRYEVILVDDGSTDGTGDIARSAAASHPSIRAVAHEQNRGVGAALRTGLELATGRVVVYTDSDMPVDMEVIGPALQEHRSGGADVVAGARVVRSGDGLVRWACTVGYDVAVRIALGVSVDDVNFAFKLAPTDLLRSLDLRSEGAFIDAELMAAAIRSGKTVRVLAMDYRPRRFGQSSTMTPRTLKSLAREFASETPRIRRIRASGAGGATGTKRARPSRRS